VLRGRGRPGKKGGVKLGEKDLWNKDRGYFVATKGRENLGGGEQRASIGGYQGKENRNGTQEKCRRGKNNWGVKKKGKIQKTVYDWRRGEQKIKLGGKERNMRGEMD